jgi:hypothetical protein
MRQKHEIFKAADADRLAVPPEGLRGSNQVAAQSRAFARACLQLGDSQINY